MINKEYDTKNVDKDYTNQRKLLNFKTDVWHDIFLY